MVIKKIVTAYKKMKKSTETGDGIQKWETAFRVIVISAIESSSVILRNDIRIKKSGPGCSKLTTSLVNVSLKFPM